MIDKNKPSKSTHSHKRTGFNVSYKETRDLSGIERIVTPKTKSVTKKKSAKIGSKIKQKKANSSYKSTRSSKGRVRKGY